jgi:hypothetical protein
VGSVVDKVLFFSKVGFPLPVYRLDGVVVSVLATGPKGCEIELGQGDGFLRVIKIRSTPSFRMGSKAGNPMP